jgi:hypothetical protein
MSILNNLKKSYGIIKRNGPSFFTGIKRGIRIGKEIIDVSKDVADKVNSISPELGARLQTITQNKYFDRLDRGLHLADNALID